MLYSQLPLLYLTTNGFLFKKLKTPIYHFYLYKVFTNIVIIYYKINLL